MTRHATRPTRYAPIACGLLLLAATALHAGDLKIENVKLAQRDTNSAAVQFDISWTNAWRHGSFHDAAWVFFKARAGKNAPWRHVRLVADTVVDPTGYGQRKDGTPLQFIVPRGDDGFTGAFVRQANYGRRRNIAAHGVTVVWDLTAARDIREPTPDTVEIRVFGVIMVYVPEGPFYLGSGGTEAHGSVRRE